jgi:hypothetical protein
MLLFFLLRMKNNKEKSKYRFFFVFFFFLSLHLVWSCSFDHDKWASRGKCTCKKCDEKRCPLVWVDFRGRESKHFCPLFCFSIKYFPYFTRNTTAPSIFEYFSLFSVINFHDNHVAHHSSDENIYSWKTSSWKQQ